MTLRIGVVLTLVIMTGVAAGCARVTTSIQSAPTVSLGEIHHPDPETRRYVKAMHDRIRSRWTYPCVSGGFARCAYPEGTVIVDVGVAPNGELASTKVIKSSGVAALDAAALDAVKAAAPFEPVPAAIRQAPALPIRLRMSYQHSMAVARP